MMTRRTFIALLSAIGILPKQAPAVAAPVPPPVVEPVEPLATYCWCSATDDGLYISGGMGLHIHDSQTGISTTFERYQMADIPRLCDFVRAQRPKSES